MIFGQDKQKIQKASFDQIPLGLSETVILLAPLRFGFLANILETADLPTP
jgi:hypothetical protein